MRRGIGAWILVVGFALSCLESFAQSSNRPDVFSPTEAEAWIRWVLNPATLSKQWSSLQKVQKRSQAWERARYLSWGLGAPNPRLPKWRLEKDECMNSQCLSNTLRLSLVWLKDEKLQERVVGRVSMHANALNNSGEPLRLVELQETAERVFREWARESNFWKDENFQTLHVPTALQPLHQRWLRDPRGMDLRWEIAVMLRQQLLAHTWLRRAKKVCARELSSPTGTRFFYSVSSNASCDAFVRAVLLEITPPT
jgi:hypothetical protein